MGNSSAKDRTQDVEVLKNKLRRLEGEIDEIMCMRESEREVYEREIMIFAMKEGEWKKERRRLRCELREMRKKLGCLEERFGGMMRGEELVSGKDDELGLLGSSYLLQQVIMEERVRREETAEKWKKLYFAIKNELDDLIQKTNQGKTLYLRVDEEDYTVEEMQKQLKAKEEAIEILQAQVASMEQQESKREREVDILRQSLRIMSHKMKPAKIAGSHSKKVAAATEQ